jgi:hypothetical protein
MKFIVTVDTEEDDWSEDRATGSPITNIGQVPKFQSLCEKYGVKPTYLLTYPITQDPESVRIFRTILSNGTCEIGVHCHPWNTPPYEEIVTKRNSMLCNLPSDLQCQKLVMLDRAIQDQFGIKPVSFRAGRWGYSVQIAQHLEKLGYKVDSSVTPYVNWAHMYGPDFTDFPLHPYRFHASNIKRQAGQGSMLEVPATIGLLGWSSPLAEKVWKTLCTGKLAVFKGTGVLAALGIIQKVWLSPEVVDGQIMIRLIEQLRGQGHTLFNMVFHSSSLKAGLTPFVRSASEEARLYRRLEEVFEYVRAEGIRPVTLSEVGTDDE